MEFASIGCGNMAYSIVSGIIESKLFDPKQMILTAPTNNHLDIVKEKYGVNISNNNLDIKDSKIVLLAIKPYFYQKVIEEIKDVIRKDALIISIAPNIKIDELNAMFGYDAMILRVALNTPALIIKGVSVYCFSDNVTSPLKLLGVNILDSFSKSINMKEELIDKTIPVTGSSPSMVYMFIESMIDGAIAEGFSYEVAKELVVDTIIGSASMVKETNTHPAILKNKVCTPGGLTIDMVKKLEETGFRSAILQSMEACTKKII